MSEGGRWLYMSLESMDIFQGLKPRYYMMSFSNALPTRNSKSMSQDYDIQMSLYGSHNDRSTVSLQYCMQTSVHAHGGTVKGRIDIFMYGYIAYSYGQPMYIHTYIMLACMHAYIVRAE